MANPVSPIVNIIISRLWLCCARHTRYLRKLQENKILLSTAMDELKEARNDVQRKVVNAEADLNEPKKRTDAVRGWLERVQIIEGEVEEILQKADEQLSRARSCLGGCCPPNKCWSNYKVGKSIAKKIPFVDELKGKGHFQEVTYRLPQPSVQDMNLESTVGVSPIVVSMTDLVSPIAFIILRLSICCARHARYLCKLQENKILLSTDMDELKEARDDVHSRVVEAEADLNEPKKRTESVRGWLERVQIIAGEVDVILQKADEQQLSRSARSSCLGVRCPPNNCWSNYKLGKSIAKKIPLVNELKGKGDFQELTYRLPPSYMNLESTVGMESMFDEVWSLINSKDDEPVYIIIGLYGHGGVGKTTLLKKINNEFNKISTDEHGFDHVVMFVAVSQPINYEDIQKKIGGRLGLSNSLQGDGDEKSRARKIFNALRNKNYVLLLDDIWERVDLRRIGIPIHPPQGNSSKLIFTTRSQRLCGLMEATHTFKVECLPWDKAWSLFQDKVGEKALTSFPRARELAKDVAKECGGLPLALITIGRAMSTKKSVQEWRDAIITLRRSVSEFEGMGDIVLPHLKLSYDDLPNNTIKYCLCYCAVFPKEWSIDKEDLVDRWIREGFILLNEFNHIDEARSYGYDVIGILKSACLLESGKDEETQVKMHDMIRDLALWIEHECGWSKRGIFFIMDTYDLTPPKTLMLYKAERIYLRFTYKGECAEVVPLKSPNLLTLICELGIPEMLLIPHNFFEFMPLLQVLDLSKCEMKTFPASITELLELQHLSLQASHIQELPLELRKLVKLEHLDLSYMKFLKKIPGGVIGSLLDLRVLNLYKCSGADHTDIEELYNLKYLNDLAITIKTEHNLNKLLSNQNLQMCTRNLQLSPCHPFSSPSLESLSNLESLTLAYLCKLADMGSGVRDQQYIVGSCFQNLSRIYIHSCNALKDLTWVGYLGNLNSLVVYFCDELEEIIISTDIMVVDVFSRLKTLKMMGLPKLKSICRNALVFPCLESMEFFECPQLMKLPFDSGSNVNNTLQKIEGEEEWWNKLQWEDDVKSKFLPLFRVFCG